MRASTTVILWAAMLAGCSEISAPVASSAGAGGSTSSGPSGGGGGGAPPSGDWELLMAGEWTLEPGTEDYLCVVANVPEDMYVGAFRPIAPVGTHHTVLTRAPAFAPVGSFGCDAGTNGENQIYGSGVNTNALVLPDGIAVRLQGGEKLLLNLHLFNSATSPLAGTSGVEIIRMDASEVEHEAELTLAGTLDLDIVPQSVTEESGTCTIHEDKMLFAVAPHMHQLGIHQKITVLHESGESVVHDQPYSFEDQRVYLLDQPIQLAPGDRVRVDCTYQNTTDDTVIWGDSSLQEMCFGTLALYPATGMPYLCVD